MSNFTGWISSEDSEEDVRVAVEEKIKEWLQDLNDFNNRYLGVKDLTLIKKWEKELLEWKKK